MRRHGDVRRLGLFALYLMDRRGTMIDGLVDLLLEIVNAGAKVGHGSGGMSPLRAA